MPITSLSGHRWRIVYNLLCRWREFLCELNGNSRTLFAATVNDCNYSRIEIRLDTLHSTTIIQSTNTLFIGLQRLYKLELSWITMNASVKIKPGFHYPSWWPELTARADGWPVSITRQHGPCCVQLRRPHMWSRNKINSRLLSHLSTMLHRNKFTQK